ncbi:MAG TPA: Na/Pi cotransporter, partial [Ruminococcaceae bacterium]|nr:Na/Pi cotransporter [Oscillospiraceae bacterium]
YFNVLGTVICLSGFYIANSIFHFTFTDQPISSFMIAVVHSAFNLITTFILLPFCNQLEKLAVITVRDKRLKPGKQDPHAVLLDERLLLSPSFA